MNNIPKHIQTLANSIARKHKHGKATKIIVDDSLKEPVIISSISYGYRKKSDNQYVPRSYVNKCRGRDVYYQNAECVVGLPKIYDNI